jgi:hypothetical protein|tara:strand:- start:3302 stop:3787 length:486 start_codon:yes stop_codon:yes gene_type:complete
VNHKQIRDLIKDTLQKIGMWSQESEELVFLTGMVESGYDYIYQIGSGIARSFWQVESATAKDCIDNYLKFRKDKLEIVANAMNVEPEKLLNMTEDELKNLLWGNIFAGIIFCRIKYWRVPKKIPFDLEGMAGYWKAYYNTEGGAGTVSHFLEKADSRKDKK